MAQTLEARARVALENVFTVVVTTRVGPCETSLDEAGDFFATPTAEGVVAQSTVDLAAGDVFHTFDPAFVTGDARELRAFHEKAVADAMALPALRLAVLKDVAAALGVDLPTLLAQRPKR
jgi:hypothetical protein